MEHNGNSAVTNSIAIISIIIVAILAVSGSYFIFSPSSTHFSTVTIGSQNGTNSTLTVVEGATTILRTEQFTQLTTETSVETFFQTLTISSSVTSGFQPFNVTVTQTCISKDNSCSGFGYSIMFLNNGNVAITAQTLVIDFQNSTSAYGESTCTINSTVPPQSTFDCNGSTPSSVPAYANIILNATFSNGKQIMFNYSPPLPTLTLVSTNLNSGSTGDNNTVTSGSSLSLTLDHVGAPVRISSVILNGSNIFPINTWSITSGKAGENSLFVLNNNLISQQGNVVLVLYPVTSPSESIGFGLSYSYVIVFGTGASASGTLSAN